ncbi:hypothetical protein HMI54_006412 [Coelomomyces lativittatus]|nr:hypothetical protein HMI54_006412 [Coelomomyces lativittatus]KAJ1509539.1 hypothetical protein HMI56_006741 [Coelomomyces lativittatus]
MKTSFLSLAFFAWIVCSTVNGQVVQPAQGTSNNSSAPIPLTNVTVVDASTANTNSSLLPIAMFNASILEQPPLVVGNITFSPPSENLTGINPLRGTPISAIIPTATSSDQPGFPTRNPSRFPGGFPGRFPGGSPGSFPDGFPGGFPGGSPGGFPNGRRPFPGPRRVVLPDGTVREIAFPVPSDRAAPFPRPLPTNVLDSNSAAAPATGQSMT